MGRGDEDDSVGKAEPETAARADNADPAPETSVTDLPPAETPSTGRQAKLRPKLPAEARDAADAKPRARLRRRAARPAASTMPADVLTRESTLESTLESTSAPTRGSPGEAAVVDKDSPGAAADAPASPARPGTPRSEAPPTDPVTLGTHRRGPGLWLPVILFVVLLAAGAVAGSVLVPGAGPDPGAAPPAVIDVPSRTRPEPAGPTTPSLPTPPPRPADQLVDWAQRIGAAVNVPAVAIQSYGYAQLTLQRQDPSCHLAWTTVAAVANVESAHGQVGGAVLQSTGRSAPVVVGPVLDGKGGRALVRDTDAGAFDGDATFDRAMGPLALTPTVWRGYGIDADSDGILDPYDIDDATLALARQLCAGTEDLSQRTGWNAALARHHSGGTYATSVFTSADSYGQRTKNMG